MVSLFFVKIIEYEVLFFVMNQYLRHCEGLSNLFILKAYFSPLLYNDAFLNLLSKSISLLLIYFIDDFFAFNIISSGNYKFIITS